MLVKDTVQRLGWWTTRGREDTSEEDLWGRILGLIEEDLEERRNKRLFVQSESGSRPKEIGDLTAQERRGLDPVLREHVVEGLLDRYLAEQGRVDLADKRRAYTKKVQDLTPNDLPDLIEADRLKTEEEHEKEREQAESSRAARDDSQRPVFSGLAGKR